MIPEFEKQLAVCERYERICGNWLLALFFVLGAETMALFVSLLCFFAMTVCFWVVFLIIQWYDYKWGREIEKLKEI